MIRLGGGRGGGERGIQYRTNPAPLSAPVVAGGPYLTAPSSHEAAVHTPDEIGAHQRKGEAAADTGLEVHDAGRGVSAAPRVFAAIHQPSAPPAAVTINLALETLDSMGKDSYQNYPPSLHMFYSPRQVSNDGRRSKHLNTKYFIFKLHCEVYQLGLGGNSESESD